MSEPVSLVTTKPDAERAAELRVNLEKALAPVCEVLDEIVEAGFQGVYQTNLDYRKKNVITLIKIVKEF